MSRKILSIIILLQLLFCVNIYAKKQYQIKTVFDARLDAQYSETQVIYDNVGDRPEGEFISATLNVHDIQNGQIGNEANPGFIKAKGEYSISIFTPLNVGAGRAYRIADIVNAIFENISFGGVMCFVPNVTRLGDDGHGYYHLDLDCPFITDNS